MCGIIGYLGNEGCKDYILSGLKLLQNRGYDSVGISFISGTNDGSDESDVNKLETIKFASSNTNDALSLLENKILVVAPNQNILHAHVGIGHTRWATHGGKTNINAHPHHDNKNRISLVHNGIIENYNELKTTLISEGYFFRSQTDTEVIAVLIGKYLDEGNTMEKSIKKTVDHLHGTWALLIIHCDHPNKIWVTRNGSPLLLGMDDEFIMVASEHIAFGNYCKTYIDLDNHDLIEVTKTDRTITITYNKNIHRYTIREKQVGELIELHPTNYDHWLIKEIMEQPQSITRALNHGGRIQSDDAVKLGGLDKYKERLMETTHLLILGCGTSYNAGLWSLDLFKQLDVFDTVAIYDGAEFKRSDIPKKGKTVVILLSQSGETKDLQWCIQLARDSDMVSIGVVNVVDSLIARETDCGVYLNAGREVSVASTKSFTNQCIVLAMISIWFSQNRGTHIETRRRLIKDLRKVSFQISSILENDSVERIKCLANVLKTTSTIFLLGKGSAQAIAIEGALKLKEVAYIHSEGYSSSALKHGTFALIVPNLPIIIFDIDEEYRSKNQNTYQELLAREAKVIRIRDESDAELVIEKNKTFGGIIANVYIQLLSYYIALELGHNPDYPKNLAKVVTVF
jgi:glucosamine--fructose-6-phosphate aminotransferase (isomerizing)